MLFGLTLTFFASQVFAGIAIISDIFSFQFKERKKIIIFFIISAICIALHYFFLERYVATTIIGIGIVRFFIAYHSTWQYWKYIFIGLFCITTFIFYKDSLDLFILFAMSLSTIASFRKDDHSLRLFMMGGTCSTILYNALIFSPIGILLESIFLGSNLVGYYRYYILKKS